MKNAILCLLATAAVSLSLAFRVAPPATHPQATDPSSAVAAPPPSRPADNAAFRDSLFYGYYSQTLGVALTPEAAVSKSFIETAANWLGTPYRGGGSTQRGTDCSGFVMRLYQQVYGVTLIHSSGGMFETTEHIKKTAMREGDLVFFRRSRRSPIYHVGIYLKDGKFIHSATGEGVIVSSLADGYWQRNFYAASRVRQIGDAAVATN